jgi:uncharacterized protein involved in propanediol utilization
LGELFQGAYWEEGVPQISIISLPVARFSWVHFIETPGEQPHHDLGALGRAKSQQAVRLFCSHYGVELPTGRWEVFSELEVGKGMASSTADVVATLRCLFRVFNLDYDQRLVIDILSRIERADSIFLDEFVLYLSGRHRIIHRFGSRIGMFTCYSVENAIIDTESLTEQLLAHYRRHSAAYQECLEKTIQAFQVGDVGAIAACSTRSAELSQLVVPKQNFDAIADRRQDFRADGLFVAHTGSVVGYLFKERPDRTLMDEISSFFRELGEQCHFAQGGWHGV